MTISDIYIHFMRLSSIHHYQMGLMDLVFPQDGGGSRLDVGLIVSAGPPDVGGVSACVLPECFSPAN